MAESGILYAFFSVFINREHWKWNLFWFYLIFYVCNPGNIIEGNGVILLFCSVLIVLICIWKYEVSGLSENIMEERRSRFLNSRERPQRSLLSEKAILKHICPECNNNQDAIRIAEERDRFYPTFVNHIFKIDEFSFEENYCYYISFFGHKFIAPFIIMLFEWVVYNLLGYEILTAKEVITSTKYCPYWKCKKKNGNYYVYETGTMKPIFDTNGHLMV